ncbi:MAG TPA: mycofactocin biosynthesis peptidyl-dipeptidase MftE [Acidimicrobiales bacterium]|jgi:creatinine amidohydrolase|nr:mycofactocin biosynthesis peptidyl-dipeptidase MftE [Acidimicrobiales bacterium]
MSDLHGLAWPEVARRSRSGAILLIPVGSTEQHGPHLPCTTDTDIAAAMAAGASERLDRVVVAPPFPYGSSGEHQGFAGTLSIGREATELALVELGRSACTDFAHVVMVSTHGGNAVPVTRAMARLAADGLPVTTWSPSWSGDLHAGRTETSLLLAIAPQRVRVDRAEPGDTRPIATLLPLLRDHGVRAVSPNGVLGDPTGASAEEGHRLLADACEQLVGRLERLDGHTNEEVTG